MIKIDGVSKKLGEFFLKDVTLDIEDGRYFMIPVSYTHLTLPTN